MPKFDMHTQFKQINYVIQYCTVTFIFNMSQYRSINKPCVQGGMKQSNQTHANSLNKLNALLLKNIRTQHYNIHEN